MASATSGSISRPYCDGAEASCHAQFPPLNAMDGMAFDENNAMLVDPTLETFNVAPDLPWEQWWSTDQSAPVGSAPDGEEMTPGYMQTSLLSGGYTCGYDTNSLGHSTWPSPATEYTAMSSVTDQVVFKESPDGGWTQTLPTENETRQRKRSLDESPSAQYTKRPSTQIDEPKTESPRESELPKSHPGNSGGGGGSSKDNSKRDKSSKGDKKGKGKETKSKKSGKNKNNSNTDNTTNNGEGSGQSPPGFAGSWADTDERERRLQHRNRIASNKFRVKKKEDALRLKSSEEGLERRHRDLTSRVAGLTHEVYLLKMQLLRHNNCGCEMIQSFLANQAHRFVEDIEEEAAEFEAHHDQQI